MVRICMVAFTHYPTDPRIRREAEMLIERGDSVDVICLGNPGDGAIQFSYGVRLFRVLIGRYRGSSALLYLAQYLLFFLLASARLASLYLKHRYHVIQVHTMPDFMVFTAAIPKLLGAKIVLDVHDLMPELYQSKFGLQSTNWLIRLLVRIERYSVGFAHRAIAVHVPHLEALIEHGNPSGKFIVMLNLPDPKIFRRSSETETVYDKHFRMIYHGTVAKRHGLRVALQALARVAETINDVELCIIGDGDDMSYLLNLSEELGLTCNVRFSKGFVPVDEIVPMIQDADVGIVPILNDEFTKYMLPTKLFEYVSLGLPVICSRTETILAHFDETMIQYVTPGDSEELAAQMRHLYSCPRRRTQLVESSSRWNLDGEWIVQKQLYYDMIDELAGTA